MERDVGAIINRPKRKQLRIKDYNYRKTRILFYNHMYKR